MNLFASGMPQNTFKKNKKVMVTVRGYIWTWKGEIRGT